MITEQKHLFEESPTWVQKISDPEILALESGEKGEEIKKAGKGLCYIFRQVVNTSNKANENYLLRIWNLNTAEILQGASITEFMVRENEQVKIHRMQVVRQGKILDKQSDVNIRVFDDEKSSVYGSINKIKKVHCIINDLRIDDIFILEYTLVTIFQKDDFLDKKYFRWMLSAPSEYWFYKEYSFVLFQNREEVVKAARRYFRAKDGQKLPEIITPVAKGEKFEFYESNYQYIFQDDFYSPYIEIATDASWQEISNYVYSVYKDHLDNHSLKDTPAYKELGLEGKDIETQIQTVIEYVQDQIIYLYDAEVMDGHLPQEAQLTMKQKSGDCKAKSLLLINLLKSLGIPADFILVNYDLDNYLKDYLPSPFVFNHAIVRIQHKDKDFYVDSTWNGRCGILEKRSEPFFSSYFPVLPNSVINIKPERADDGLFNIENQINIDLKKDQAVIKKESVYRRESADIMRNNFKVSGQKDNLKYEHDFIFNASLGFNKTNDIDALFLDGEYKVLEDDKKNNVFKVLYETKVNNPYSKSGKINVFKFYYDINYSQIEKHKHKDRLCESFCSYPLRYSLKIETQDFVVDTKDSIIKKELDIQNLYFSFSNKKKIGSKILEVFSEYKPKTYKLIAPEEVENLKNDYIKMMDSNFGVGIYLLNPWQSLTKKWYFFIVLYILFAAIIGVIVALV